MSPPAGTDPRLALLAEAGRLLASSLDYQATLEQVARLVLPSLADLCIVDVVEADRVFGLAIAHVDPEKERAVRELRARYPLHLNGIHPVLEVIRTGQARRDPDPPAFPSAPVGANDLHYRVARQLAVESSLTVPLVSRGEVLGALGLSYAGSGRRHTAEDQLLAQEIAVRAAQAIDNARLYRDLCEEHRASERARAMLDALLACAPIGIAFLDPELRYLSVNPTLARLHGRSPEEYRGRTPAEMIPSLAPRLEPVMRRVLESGEPVLGLEVRTEPAPDDPGARDWLASYYPVRTGEGELIGVGVGAVEVTELKQAVRALEEALAQVRRLRGILPICSHCKKIRDDQNYWQQVESYISEHTEASFSHGICPECFEEIWKPQFPDLRYPES